MTENKCIYIFFYLYVGGNSQRAFLAGGPGLCQGCAAVLPWENDFNPSTMPSSESDTERTWRIVLIREFMYLNIRGHITITKYTLKVMIFIQTYPPSLTFQFSRRKKDIIRFVIEPCSSWCDCDLKNTPGTEIRIMGKVRKVAKIPMGVLTKDTVLFLTSDYS